MSSKSIASSSYLLLFYIGAPSKPGQPEVVKTGKNHCDLRWAPPRSDGGTRIKGYDVEVRDYPDGLWVIFYITLFIALARDILCLSLQTINIFVACRLLLIWPLLLMYFILLQLQSVLE